MQTEVYASTYGRVLTVALGVVGVLVVVGVASLREPRALAIGACAAGLLVGGGWALFWRPRVEVADGGVTVVNVARTIHVPWPVLVEAEPGWSLVVRTTRHAWTAWAAPRSSATGSGVQRIARRRVRGDVAAENRPQRRRATSEVVADAITRRQDALLAAGHLDGARTIAEHSGLAETVTWHRGTIAGALALVCGLVLAVTL